MISRSTYCPFTIVVAFDIGCPLRLIIQETPYLIQPVITVMYSSTRQLLSFFHTNSACVRALGRGLELDSREFVPNNALLVVLPRRCERVPPEFVFKQLSLINSSTSKKTKVSYMYSSGYMRQFWLSQKKAYLCINKIIAMKAFMYF